MHRSSLLGATVLVVAACVGLGAGGGARAAERTEDVAFQATVDGTEQRYVAIVPEAFGAGRRGPALIALHGHGSDRWQFVKEKRDECRAARDVARAHGMLFISPDYRAKTSWMGPAAEADLVQIIGDLRARHGVGKVVLCGASMGGTGVLTFTALHPDLVDGVVSLNGTANLVEYPNFAEAIAESYGGTREQKPLEYRQRSAEFFPERFTMPVAIATGGKDRSVPSDSTLRLAAAIAKRNRDVLVLHREQGGHSTTYDDATAALEFVVQRLAKAKAKAKR